MAIDSAEKRRAISGIPFFPLGLGVTPNLAKDAEWRQQVGWSYSGIAVTASSGASMDWLYIYRANVEYVVRRYRRH